MRLGQFCFRPHPVPTLALTVMLPLFVMLGIWQLDRAAYKRELSAARQRQDQQPPLVLEELMDSAKVMAFREVRAAGRFEQQHQVFIENRKYRGRNGYHVVTPLKLSDSEVRVLVNRGWVPPAPNPDLLPVVETPAKTVQVTGVVDIPAPPALALDQGNALQDGPARWPYLTVERFASGVNYPVQPFVILQSPQDEHGFVRAWPRHRPNDAMHIGYALQWFAFAAIALILYLYLSVSRARPGIDR